MNKLIEPKQFNLAEDDFYDDRCGDIFITTNRLLVLRCFICGHKYGNMSNFLEHWKVHHQDKKIYPSNLELDLIEASSNENINEEEINSEHLSVQTIEDCPMPLKRTKCVRVYIDSHSMDNLAKLSDPDNSKEKKYTEKSKNLLESNVLDQITNQRKKLLPDSHKHYKCDQCRKSFETPSGLRYHATVHSEERKFRCALCNIRFKHKSNLRAHMRRHSGEKNFTCNFCDKRFFSSTQNMIHQRIHTGERPFICSKCGRTCISSSELSTHTKRHNNIRPHKCSHCDRAFYKKNMLKIHMSVHTKERPFACNFCTSKFSRRQTLKVHMKLHANIKEYACNLCEKTFNQRPALLSHLKINHKVADHQKKETI